MSCIHRVVVVYLMINTGEVMDLSCGGWRKSASRVIYRVKSKLEDHITRKTRHPPSPKEQILDEYIIYGEVNAIVMLFFARPQPKF